MVRQGLGRARGHQVSAAATAFRSEIDDPVCRLDDIEVVFDHDHGIALVAQPAENLEELGHICKMEPVVGSSRR